MITKRVLPPDEWYRLAETEPFASGGLPDPTYWRIVVVERDGVIVAMSSLFDSVHWDLFDIAESERGNPAVVKALIEAGIEVMEAHGIKQVHTTVPDSRPDLMELLERLGFERAPGQLFSFTRP